MKKVTIFMGGKSLEREISLLSGKEVIDSLQELGYEVVVFDPKFDKITKLIKQQPDVVFNALHGENGEDGIMQGVCEFLQIPYTHSGVLASALTMNKSKCKQIIAQGNIDVAKELVLCTEQLKQYSSQDTLPLPYPFVIKPNSGGSSNEVFLIKNYQAYLEVIQKLQPKKLYLIEEYIEGKELTVSVLGDRALTVTEIFTQRFFYDYKAKYDEGMSKHVLPAQIDQEIFALSRQWSLMAHNVLGCRGLSRSDFRYDPATNRLVYLETNTQPGMTKLSLSPEQAKYSGLSFNNLIAWLINDASLNR